MKIRFNKNDNKYDIEFESTKEASTFNAYITDMIGIIFDICEEVLNEDVDEGTCNINLEKMIKKVTYHNDKATVVNWEDGSVTKSVCHNGDVFNKETGLAMCIIRKLCNNRSYSKVFDKWAH